LGGIAAVLGGSYSMPMADAVSVTTERATPLRPAA